MPSPWFWESPSERLPVIEQPGILNTLNATLVDLIPKELITDQKQQRTVVATEGPSIRGDEIFSFWNIVLTHKVGLIVNLCRNCGNSSSWHDESAQYWPTDPNEVMRVNESDI